MSDVLLDLSRNPTARELIKSLGLPIPLPEPLRRGAGPLEDRPLEGANVVVGASPGASLAVSIAHALAAAGATPHVASESVDRDAYETVGEAFGRPPQWHESRALPEGVDARALLFDATGIAEPGGLRALFDFFGPLLPRLVRSGRVVVVGRPPGEQASPASAAAQTALRGFVRSLAKEIGKRGSTANLVVVSTGAEERIEGTLRFLLSARSAFVTGQPFEVSARARGSAGSVSYVHALEHEVALVTGAARGIGAATAKRLAEEGARVICLDLPSDDAPVARLARDVGGRVVLADVTDVGAPEQIVAALDDRGVDVVVHNAGVTRDKTLAKMRPEAWDQVVDVNLCAVTRITEALLRRGAVNDGGRIVCLSSVAGIAGNVGQTNYAASKSGLIGLVERLADQLADRGITVNAVAPGFIETRLTARIPPVIREAGRRLSALAQGGLPEDVAEVITFLASPASQGITGATVRVCGGAFIGA